MWPEEDEDVYDDFFDTVGSPRAGVRTLNTVVPMRVAGWRVAGGRRASGVGGSCVVCFL